MENTLRHLHGALLIVRAPVPVTFNKAGANYKSEVAHSVYAPRQAYDEWISICEAILACGGDALVDLEPADEPFLDCGDLHIDGQGAIRPTGSRSVLGNADQIQTGRVFTANGPWVTLDGSALRATLPNMLPHRQAEAPYYQALLEQIAELGGYELAITANPHRWEGMADIAAVGDSVVLTYTVSGHYDAATTPKTMRSSREGVAFAADAAGVSDSARIYAELVYPHFHGDTVGFGLRPPGGASPHLVHYREGLWPASGNDVAESIGSDAIVPVSRDDAVDAYATNSRQVRDGVLVPSGVSADFERRLAKFGLTVHRVALYELFGKAGGGPACATLYLPDTLTLPERAPIRYSQRRDWLRARRERIPEVLAVAPEYFADKPRG